MSTKDKMCAGWVLQKQVDVMVMLRFIESCSVTCFLQTVRLKVAQGSDKQQAEHMQIDGLTLNEGQ